MLQGLKNHCMNTKVLVDHKTCGGHIIDLSVKKFNKRTYNLFPLYMFSEMCPIVCKLLFSNYNRYHNMENRQLL